MNEEIFVLNKMEQKDVGISIFLKKIMENFANQELITYKKWNSFHFIYNERCAMSSLIPAIHNITENIWLEDPFVKKTSSESASKDVELGHQNRRIDIVTKNNKSLFFIEVKHFFDRGNYNSLYSYAKKRIEKTISQIEDITRSRMEVCYDDFNKDDYKMALMIVPTFLSRNETSKEYDEKTLNMSAEKYANIIYDKCIESDCIKPDYVNYVVTWKLKNPLKYEIEWQDGFEIYPFVNFIIKIEKLA